MEGPAGDWPLHLLRSCYRSSPPSSSYFKGHSSATAEHQPFCHIPLQCCPPRWSLSPLWLRHRVKTSFCRRLPSSRCRSFFWKAGVHLRPMATCSRRRWPAGRRRSASCSSNATFVSVSGRPLASGVTRGRTWTGTPWEDVARARARSRDGSFGRLSNQQRAR
jgi:hypothetical protein